MIKVSLTCLLLLPFALLATDPWIKEKRTGYTLAYTKADKTEKDVYTALVDNGIKAVQTFFGGKFKTEFEVWIYPNRLAIEAQWQKDWNLPDFKSECWMVASGVATKLDLIAPKAWDRESCEHKYADKPKVQQLITHELVHVFHGQQNASPDFSDVVGIDWLVEGLATYAAGQLDESRLAELHKAIGATATPATLDKFWTGKFKYGLSGSVAWFIDKRYGRARLKQLLAYNTLDDVLQALNTTESDLLRDWKKFVLSN
jgi:hypothetical protein